MRSMLIAHCGFLDKNLFAFDLNNDYKKAFQCRTIECSFGAICKYNDPEDYHFVLGMKNGWISLYSITNTSGLNERVSK
jgi:hypothetical protein